MNSQEKSHYNSTLQQLLSTSPNRVTDSTRIIYTPSSFAKSTLFYLQEIGKLKSLAPHISRREMLDSFLYISVLKGCGNLVYNGKTYVLQEGDHAFIDCRQSYSHQSNEKSPWELIWIHFNGSNLRKYFTYFKNNDILLPPVHSSKYCNIHSHLMELAKHNDTDTEFLISLALHEMVTQLLIESSESLNERHNDKMIAVKEFVDIHFHEKITLESLSKEFYMSKYYLAREFKEYYGISIISYAINKRVTKSKELLRFSDMGIEEIARTVGVEDRNYFNKMFQKIEGITPSGFRKTWKK